MRLIDADDFIARLDHVPMVQEAIKKAMDHMPTIEERKKGKWIYKSELGWGETWLCSECGEKTTSTITGKPRYNWCPMCGADMRGET